MERQESVKGRWGWRYYRPDYLQRFNKPVWALVFVSIGIFLQSFIINGLLHIDLPVIERRFNLNAKQAGFICSSYDVTSVTLLIPFTYFGGQEGTSKPIWYGSGLILMGIGSFTFFLPELLVFYLSASSKFSDARSLVCAANTSYSYDSFVRRDSNATPSVGFWIFLFANLICGAGGSILYTLGITYLEESVTKKKSSAYIGVFYITAIIGPAVGFVVGAFLLNIDNKIFFPDRGTTKIIRVSPEDSSYIGAWWLGFIVCSGLFMLVSIPAFGFPIELPDTANIRASKIQETHRAGILQEDCISVRDMPKAVFNLLRNPTFMFLSLAGCCDSSVINTTSIFMPKILENQFYLGHEKAAFSIGTMMIVGGICGIISGAIIQSYYDLNCCQTLKFCIYCCIVSSMFMAGFHIHCAAKPFAGINAYYFNTSGFGLTKYCNSLCNCPEEVYSPVCGIDNITYYSACFAGCDSFSINKGFNEYYDCACINPYFYEDPHLYQATSKTCQISCNIVIIFLLLSSGALFCIFTTLVPGVSATLKCVDRRQKSLAIGLQWLMIRGWGIFAPALYGNSFDSACIYWRKTWTEKGSCVIYDNKHLSRLLFYNAAGTKVVGIICFILSFALYKPSVILGTE